MRRKLRHQLYYCCPPPQKINGNYRRQQQWHNFFSDMFNVFLSLAKEGANGALPLGSSNNKEQLVMAVYRQYRAKKRLMEPYNRLRNAIKHMQEEYAQSKQQNLLVRYTHMQKIIHEVIQLERQYWQLIDIPAQAISETPQAYVLRIAELLDEQRSQHDAPTGTAASSPRPGSAIAQLLGSTICIAERTKDSSMFTAMRAKSIEELREQCAQLSTDLFRLIHRYQALRLAVRELARAYQHTRYYPLVPRYNLLKAMIKRILRTPAVCEQDPMLHENY